MLSKYFFSFGLLCVGGVALVMPKGYSLGLYLICITSLVLWLKARDVLVNAQTRFFFWPLLAYGLGQCALALHEKLYMGEVGTYLPFVLVLFGLWGIRTYKPKAVWFYSGLAVGAIAAAVLSGYQSMQLGQRAGGFTHPIQFGNIALLFGVLCLVRAVVVPGATRLNALMWMGFVSGLAASVWSQTRGGWVAVVLIFIWILINATKSWAPIKRTSVALGLLLVLLLPALQPNGVVQSRIKEAVTEVNAFVESGKQDTSVGARLAMWKLGLEGIQHAPFLGSGDQGWLNMRDAALADGRLSQFSAGFTHLHNEYLNMVFKRGLVGLALFLALYLVPMLMFFKPYLHDERAEVRALAMAGMVIPMMFMDFGLTQTFLSHNSGRVVLCGLWMCVAGLMLNAIEASRTNEDA